MTLIKLGGIGLKWSQWAEISPIFLGQDGQRTFLYGRGFANFSANLEDMNFLPWNFPKPEHTAGTRQRRTELSKKSSSLVFRWPWEKSKVGGWTSVLIGREILQYHGENSIRSCPRAQFAQRSLYLSRADFLSANSVAVT